MADIELLNKAIETFNSASSTLVKYYSSLEEKVKLLTEEVDHKKQLLDSILDSIDIGVIFFDSDGVVRLINNTAENLLNVKAAEIIGGNNIYAAIQDEVIAPDNGKPFFALVSRLEVKDKSGNISGHVLIFKDITRLRQLESENERNRRLTAMGEFVLKIAHEIRNPLGSIELFASLLYNDLKGTEHGDYASRISNSVGSLVNTLDNMLRFSKGIMPGLEYCSLNNLVNDICSEFGKLLSSVNIYIDFIETGQYSLPIDKGLIRQAFVNILLNSVQAMPDGGKIEINIRELDTRIQGCEDPLGKCVEISIKDSGVGMDEETSARIFEPFFSTKDRGTGLGMSITAGIINAHKGSIDVKSEIGKGTEFIIKLPVKPL